MEKGALGKGKELIVLKLLLKTALVGKQGDTFFCFNL